MLHKKLTGVNTELQFVLVWNIFKWDSESLSSVLTREFSNFPAFNFLHFLSFFVGRLNLAFNLAYKALIQSVWMDFCNTHGNELGPNFQTQDYSLTWGRSESWFAIHWRIKLTHRVYQSISNHDCILRIKLDTLGMCFWNFSLISFWEAAVGFLWTWPPVPPLEMTFSNDGLN
jgi:hypothetical protein